jgi:hypothetical protein
VVGDVVLSAVGQAREALLAFSDDHAHSQLLSFELGYVLWMVSAWYVARLLVGKRFEPDLIGVCSSPGFAQGLTPWLPRLLALTAGLPIPARAPVPHAVLRAARARAAHPHAVGLRWDRTGGDCVTAILGHRAQMSGRRPSARSLRVMGAR